METKSISRRDLLKSTGVLIVGFSFFGTAARALAQGDGLSVDGMDPTVLDSWLAISKDGTVTVFTGKVELGTGRRDCSRADCGRRTRCALQQSLHGFRRHG